MHCLFSAPGTKLFEFNFALHFLFVLARIEIHPLADGALQPYEFVGILRLGHEDVLGVRC